MTWVIDQKFSIPVNDDVLAFVKSKNPSAHSDVADELIIAARGLPDVHHYCPNPERFAFVFLCTKDNRVFGLAYGQSAFCLCVGEPAMVDAVAEGAETCMEIGAEWIVFNPFLPEIKRAEMQSKLREWTAKAFAYVSGL